MPLPKPPAKRADFLSRADFDSPAVPRPGKRTGRQAASEPVAPAVLELSNEGTLPAAPPVVAKAIVAAPPVQAPVAMQPERPHRPRGNGPATLFVLDTNVLMHDPTSLFRFDEHDIYLPMITLEELDGHKRGMTEVARNARQVSRDLDALAANMPTRDAAGRSEGIALNRTGHREAGGKLFFQTDLIHVSLPQGLPQGKADNQILGVVKALVEQQPAARRRAGVQGHQHAHQGACPRPAGGRLLQRQDARRRRPALHRHAAAARRLLGQARQDGRELAAGWPHLLPDQRRDRRHAADQPVRLPRRARRALALCQGDRDHRQDRGAAHAQGLHPPEELGLGRDGAKPRPELRLQPADGSGVRLHHPHRHGRHRARR